MADVLDTHILTHAHAKKRKEIRVAVFFDALTSVRWQTSSDVVIHRHIFGRSSSTTVLHELGVLGHRESVDSRAAPIGPHQNLGGSERHAKLPAHEPQPDRLDHDEALDVARKVIGRPLGVVKIAVCVRVLHDVNVGGVVAALDLDANRWLQVGLVRTIGSLSGITLLSLE